jgi:hypothetical protein
MKSLLNYSLLHGYTVNNELSYSQKKDMLITLKLWSHGNTSNWLKRTHLTVLHHLGESHTLDFVDEVSEKMLGLVGLLLIAFPFSIAMYLVLFPLNIHRGILDGIIVNRLNKKQHVK